MDFLVAAVEFTAGFLLGWSVLEFLKGMSALMEEMP